MHFTVATFVQTPVPTGDAPPIPKGVAQQVFLSSNNPTPCYNNTVDLICYYPDVMERVNGQPRYTVTTPSWRVNGAPLFLDGYLVVQQIVNQTASRLRVRIDPAIFTGDPVSFTCYLPLTSGGEDSASTVVDPQGECLQFIWQDYHSLAMKCFIFHVESAS